MGADETEQEVKKEVVEDEKPDTEDQSKKLPYPKSVFFIVSNEFCERFSFYGMRTILSIYLHDKLLFSESDSTILYHAFTVFVYTFPILGAIVSDSWLGKFRTILYLSMVYACGNILLSLASATEVGLPQIPFSLLGLFIIALGTGGIKPCVAAFGGDQFKLPQQELQLASFFSVFYFSINAGSLISSFMTPMLREVKCLGEKTCFPLAFGVPGALMILSIIIFAVGRPMYKMSQPKGNLLVRVSKCIVHALRTKSKSDKKLDHWMDYSEEKYGRRLVADIKLLLNVALLFVPLPIFWALYDQQGSAWTFQAARMDGRIGSFTLLPDQMQVINAVLILAFIPLFTYGVYPLMARCNLLKTHLQRMACGGFLAALAFGISVGVAFALEAKDPVLPSGHEIQLRLYNPFDCKVTIDAEPYIMNTIVPEMGYVNINTKINGKNEIDTLDYTVKGDCVTFENKTGSYEIKQSSMYAFTVSSNGFLNMTDSIEKSRDGLPLVRTLVSTIIEGYKLKFKGDDIGFQVETNDTELLAVDPGNYKLEGFSNNSMEFLMGGVYTVVVNMDGSKIIHKVHSYEITTHNSIHMLLLIPQYVVLTAAEIMYSLTGLEFSYDQAPISMKSVIQALFLLTTAVGNLIIVIIESIKMFDKQSYDFLLYTGLMLLDMLVFAFLANKYVYVTKEELNRSIDDDNSTTDITEEDDAQKTKF